MIINKNNIINYCKVFKNSNPKPEIIKYIFKRIIGKKELFKKDIISRDREFIFNCGKVIENCKMIYDEVEENIDFDINDGVIIDVGAHIGTKTIPILKNKNIKAILIEPNKEMFDLLKINIHLNRVSEKAELFNIALADKEKGLIYYKNKHHPGSNSIIDLEEVKGKEIKDHIKMKCSTLDIICSEIKNIKVIKIDVEGAELLVLKGAKKILSEQHPKIYFEAWTLEKAKEIELYLKEFNYGDMKKINRFDYLIEVINRELSLSKNTEKNK